jgi:spore protease
MGSSVRTDLAVESREFLLGGRAAEVPGVHCTEERFEHTLVTRVEVATPEAQESMGKTMGNYITLEAPGLRSRNRLVEEEVASVFARELARLINLNDDTSILVVGLGNWNATPDSLGPKVVSELLITRHLQDYVPPELKGKLRSVCAVAPGVLGLTGIETGEIIRGIVDRVRPDIVIAVDALAARKLERIVTTLQLADTGIHPGSGVGNRRIGVTAETIGCPVVAIGVPTVVHASTVAYDAIELLLEEFRGQTHFYDILSEMDDEDKRRLMEEILSPAVGDLMVTPKEIDVHIMAMSRVMAKGLNIAFHPGIDQSEMNRYFPG